MDGWDFCWVQVNAGKGGRRRAGRRRARSPGSRGETRVRCPGTRPSPAPRRRPAGAFRAGQQGVRPVTAAERIVPPGTGVTRGTTATRDPAGRAAAGHANPHVLTRMVTTRLWTDPSWNTPGSATEPLRPVSSLSEIRGVDVRDRGWFGVCGSSSLPEEGLTENRSDRNANGKRFATR